MRCTFHFDYNQFTLVIEMQGIDALHAQSVCVPKLC